MARRAMVDSDLRGRDINDSRVLKVMAEIPREAFVPAKYVGQSYADYPLPIGMGQTISQPYMVALMTQCLELSGTEEVLEIGTGSGYQTAILSKLAARVYTIERFCELAQSAQTVLSNLGLTNIEYYIGDGSTGWPEPRHFDRIIVTAGVPEVPPPLIDQLKDGGLLTAPIGGQWSQELIVGRKQNNQLTTRTVCGCRFVPLIGRYGYSEPKEMR
ncbi:MAG TPA: protein-L-isoaspartate(D-aspartate) O-methyltransferase [Anaerohalosphaeraceae bacterium]|nr:protein-L-isoaspartate(D-aspartate) O-methyltransferase [Anaerohalosphaeraceae bacterium]HOL32104.1 protein-L-isoaspartate(D-aspartate) O-methyltransferase [Anaerohalosphaeraceae bacterium]HOM76362.1 protein-L-isoaspartate(D-aspartate) O-methyltransferase [Anaerohalosphaeraceae bacterium]HPO68836.1 protein-L-isoaspartate(D-aspartate) O-methyltransferase [Anaerohalosphaeraceae bacterium]HRV19827.1 protein-L-isoaspartate(D-aspartate) O-methyltransferase [Anaerohalosphaeraceae bacterium]